jgi:hypothetical protein
MQTTSMISGEVAFDRVLEAIQPVFLAHGLHLIEEERHPEAFGSRHTTYGDESLHVRLVWDGKEQWFVLEVDESPGRTAWPGWIDLTLQRFDPQQATSKWVDEVIEDVRAALVDYLGAPGNASSR